MAVEEPHKHTYQWYGECYQDGLHALTYDGKTFNEPYGIYCGKD